ncbi:MAG: hypothetical protein DRQ35_04610 [Gammaproteobacteria bacterium]|nr:MAG: hypothetical protein DRQ35_04610 [Gammaproteobacteria bacterium]
MSIQYETAFVQQASAHKFNVFMDFEGTYEGDLHYAYKKYFRTQKRADYVARFINSHLEERGLNLDDYWIEL